MILLIKPTKQGGFWSFTGLSFLIFVPIFIFIIIIQVIFVLPFVEVESTLNMASISIMLILGLIGETFIVVHVYAKIRIVTSIIAKKISLIYFILVGISWIIDILLMLTWPQLRESREYYNYPIITALNVVGSLLTVIIMKKLLLNKARQQVQLPSTDAPSV